MRTDLSRRSNESELMDASHIDYPTYRDALRDLARVNVLSLGYRPTLAFLDRLRRAGRLPQGRPLRVLDVGSGYGDLLRAVDRWTRRHGGAAELTGVDLSPWSTRAAHEATPPDVPIRWINGDVFAFESSVDVILSSLFTHHLDDAGVVAFLRWMETRAALGWFVNDLHRHALPHATFGPLAAGLGLHRFVRHDGRASFRRAFRPQDWAAYLREAGIEGAEVQRWFPFRLCVARLRGG